MKLPQITIVNADSGDWTGIYFDGKLVAENHGYDATDILDLLKITYEEREIDMGEDSRLPARLEEIK